MKRKELKISAYDSVRDVYINSYPTDELGKEIKEEVMLIDVFKRMLFYGNDIYDIIGVDDSIVRERIFQMIVDCGLVDKYNQIYNIWLKS